MSIHLLENPDRRHDILDDLESVFWLLLYGSLHFLKHEARHFSMKLFDKEDIEFQDTDNEPRVTGGGKKRIFLDKCEFEELKFHSNPLNDLVCQLAEDFHTIYRYERSKRPRERKEAQDKCNLLRDVSTSIEKFERALECDDWPEDKDRTRDQFPRKTEKQVACANHHAQVSSYGSQSLSRHNVTMLTSTSIQSRSMTSDPRSISRSIPMRPLEQPRIHPGLHHIFQRDALVGSGSPSSAGSSPKRKRDDDPESDSDSDFWFAGRGNKKLKIR